MLFSPENAPKKENISRRQLRANKLASESNVGGIPPYTWTMANTSIAEVTASSSKATNTVVGVKAGSTTLSVKDVVGNSGSASVVVTAA